MKKVKILDCTIRDGGYYTNWDFNGQLVENYFEAFNHLPVDYLEIGYRSSPLKGYYGEYFYCPDYVLENARNSSNKKLAIILNEKDVPASDAKALLYSAKGKLDMIRLAVDPKNFERALLLGEEIKKLGFELSFNIMYMSEWEKMSGFVELMPKTEGLVDYIYMVDSFGGVFPEDVEKTINLIRSKTNVKLGFHGHDNLNMGLANTLVAIAKGVDIVDATVTGMGRGAGNLKTELLLAVLDAKGHFDLDYNWLSKITDPFQQLQKKHEWGTSLPYMVSGANSLPQKQVMEWVGKRYYSFNSIIRALDNKSKGRQDNKQLPKINFAEGKSYKTALIVAGGPSAIGHFNALKQFLLTNNDVVLIHASSKNALNYQQVSNEQYFCLVGNEGHRLEDVFGQCETINGKCVLPPYPRKMGTYIPNSLLANSYELLVVDFTTDYQDSHTALALQTALNLNVENIFVAGYDGYSESTMGEKEQELFMENEFLFECASKALGKKIESLTLTSYKNLVQSSVYSILK